jgi:alpha-glucosidase (family GH31 glycosyl hydrolase)
MYTYVVKAHNGGEVLQRPAEGKYHYLFGDQFLVAPIYKDELKNKVTLPEGKWRNFFDDKAIIEGPVTFEREFPLEEYPVYIREGAIVPMDIKREYTRIGNQNSTGYLTLLIYPNGKNEFTVYHPDKTGSTTVLVSDDSEKITVSLENIHKPHILNINIPAKPKKVELDHILLQDSVNYNFDQKLNKLIIKTNTYITGNYLIYR